MIDYHTHILPQMDDGSESVEMTAQMLAELERQGVDTVVATPHFYATSDDPEDFLRRRAEAIALLPPTPLKVVPGAEVAYFSGIGQCREIEGLCIGDSKLLLVEMPYTKWSVRMIGEICQISQELGLQPVLAHVDRYRKEFNRFRPQLEAGGVLFQCNVDAFIRLKARRWAFKLLKQNAFHFWGTDSHNLSTRGPKIVEAYAAVAKKLGSCEALDAVDAASRQLLGME